MFYLTGFHLTSAHTNRLAKLTKSTPWPSKENPLLNPQNPQNLPQNSIVLVKNPSDSDLRNLAALKPVAIIDANALDESVRDFAKKLDGIPNRHKMGFLLTCPVIYACNIAETITQILQQFITFAPDQKGNIHFALHEAIVNGLIHGNLQLNSSMRQSARDFVEYARLLRDRLNDPSYAQKSISIVATWNPRKLELKIRDEGIGYGNSSNPVRHSNALRHKTGRGIRMIAGAADSCTIEDFGREITLSFLLQDQPLPQLSASYQEEEGSPSAIMLAQNLYASKVLVIEDEAPYQIMLKRFLEQLIGVSNIAIAGDGVEGLKLAHEFKPDLIILDLTMPRMDGYEVIQHLKENEDTKNIPVLIETASENLETRNRTFRAGAADFFVKPFDPLEFTSRVRVHLEHRLLVRSLSNKLNQIESELQVARRMQMNMFPSDDTLKDLRKNYGVNIAQFFMSSSLLGGDLWQVIPLSTNKFAFYICDFSGHGVASALNTFRLHALISQYTKKLTSPATFLEHVNNQMIPLLQRGQFATMFLGIFDKKTKTLSYAGAGHPDPILMRRKKQIPLQAEGMPLGIQKNMMYRDQTLKMQKNDLLFLYSDALVESMTKKGKRFGAAALQRLVQKHIDGADISNSMDQLLEDFFKLIPPPPPDDVTGVLLKWESL